MLPVDLSEKNSYVSYFLDSYMCPWKSYIAYNLFTSIFAYDRWYLPLVSDINVNSTTSDTLIEGTRAVVLVDAIYN